MCFLHEHERINGKCDQLLQDTHTEDENVSYQGYIDE